MKLLNRLLYIREGCSIFFSVEYIEAELVSWYYNEQKSQSDVGLRVYLHFYTVALRC